VTQTGLVIVKARRWISERTDVILEKPTILASPIHVEMEELVSPSTLIQPTCAGVRKDSLELIVKKKYAHQVIALMAESANLLATYKLVFASLASLEIDAKRKKSLQPKITVIQIPA